MWRNNRISDFVRQLFSNRIVVLVLIGALYHTIVTAQQDGVRKSNMARPTYKLVWADEFNTDGPPDSSNWSFEQGFVRNNEDQWYQPQNAFCQNGMLIIEARKETRPNPLYEVGSDSWRKQRKDINYTSSSLRTAGKRSWQYGRFVMRGKIDVSSGLWPAWWMLGISGRWPAGGEIDIMEFYRKKLLANIACMGSNGKPEWYSNTFSTDSLGGNKWAGQFHIWQMDWDENAIALSLDGKVLNKVSIDKLVNKDGSNINPFKQPQYMLLNLALGGQNGGSLEQTIFPSRFEIDYVRVYQKQ